MNTLFEQRRHCIFAWTFTVDRCEIPQRIYYNLLCRSSAARGMRVGVTWCAAAILLLMAVGRGRCSERNRPDRRSQVRSLRERTELVQYSVDRGSLRR